MADPAEMVEASVLRSFQEFLPDAEFSLADRAADGPDLAVLSDGAHACVGWTVEGTHEVDWPGIGPSSGRRITVIGATFVSGVDDSNPREHSVIDWASVMAQVGTLAFDRPVELDDGVPTS